MHVTAVAALVGFAFSATVLADECATKCTNAFQQCYKNGTAVNVCASNYAYCLGYNPFEQGAPYAEPTSCKGTQGGVKLEARTYGNNAAAGLSAGGNSGHNHHGNYGKHKGHNRRALISEPVDACAKQCSDDFQKCFEKGTPVNDCASDYSFCLGYNPFIKAPFDEAKTCHKPELPVKRGILSCSETCVQAASKCIKDGKEAATCGLQFVVCELPCFTQATTTKSQ
ncbi:nuclear distribution protein [Purpureocillium lavendulum]|uniref:Nuclear distribution protein n=1 Tax=Purpureocillium lavendulum TaxID=1247861 RepID=A0AB34G591_9HYPO|nr:nuclear distribution protein [Purpureocillium lavendulum]